MLKDDIDEFKHAVKFIGPEQVFIVGFKSVGDRRLMQNELLEEMGIHVTSKEDADTGVRRAGYRFSGTMGLYGGTWKNAKPDGKGTDCTARD